MHECFLFRIDRVHLYYNYVLYYKINIRMLIVTYNNNNN